MSGENISNAMNFIDDDLIESVEAVRGGKRAKNRVWVKLGAAAACLCVIAVGVICALNSNNSNILTTVTDGTPVLKWFDGFNAEDYFTYNSESETGVSSSSSAADSAVPYAAVRYFSDYREDMENNAVIPEMPDHPLFDCAAHYNEDGSIYSVTFSWHRREDVYSDLVITAGYQEVQQIQDCIAVELDEDGNIVPASVTVTERDGVQIVAEGSQNRDKTLTFQNDTGWYQITGSWNDSFDSVAELLDWVWEHPIDFALFDMSKGIEITGSNLDEYPDAFAAYIPDFDSMGYVITENYVSLKNGVPYSFEGHYYPDGGNSASEIHWCVDSDPDYYDIDDSVGDISELTENIVAETLSENSSIAFMMGDCFIKVYAKDAAKVWQAIQTLTY